MKRLTALIQKGLSVLLQRLSGQGLRVTWLWLYEKIARLSAGVSPAGTSRVTDRVFVGGQHYARGLATMQAWGIGATVNLCAEADDAACNVAVGRYLWLPTPDDGAPTMEQLRQGVRFIAEVVSGGQSVYIHCAQGVGRAPTMAAAYLIAEGQSVKEALMLICRVRPFITPTPAQLRRLEEWAAATVDDGQRGATTPGGATTGAEDVRRRSSVVGS